MQISLMHEPLKKDVFFVTFFSIITVIIQFCLRYFQSENPFIMTFREGLIESVSTFLLATLILIVMRQINVQNKRLFINSHIILAVIYSILSVLIFTVLFMLYSKSNIVSRLFDNHLPYNLIINLIEYVIIFCVAYSLISIKQLKSMTQKAQFNADSSFYSSAKNQFNPLRQNRTYLNRIVISETNRVNILTVGDIISIEACIDYTKLIINDKNYFIDTHKMHYFEDRLDPNQFMRIHRSTIINLDSIKNIRVDQDNKMKITLNNDVTYPVSKTGQKKLKSLGNIT